MIEFRAKTFDGDTINFTLRDCPVYLWNDTVALKRIKDSKLVSAKTIEMKIPVGEFKGRYENDLITDSNGEVKRIHWNCGWELSSYIVPEEYGVRLFEIRGVTFSLKDIISYERSGIIVSKAISTPLPVSEAKIFTGYQYDNLVKMIFLGEVTEYGKVVYKNNRFEINGKELEEYGFIRVN